MNGVGSIFPFFPFSVQTSSLPPIFFNEIFYLDQFTLWLSSFAYSLTYWSSLVAQTVKILPARQEAQVRSLGRKDSLEEEMVTHSSILAGTIPWTKEPSRLQSMGPQKSQTRLSTHEF